MSKDKNEALDLVVGELMPYFQAGVNCVIVGDVVFYDGKTADVQPAPLDSNGNKRSIIGNCLVLANAAEYLKGGSPTKMKRGDRVVVVFHDRDLDNYEDSGQFMLASRRMHSLNDGIVIGVVKQ
ncbi:Gp138 family membrane-puncturing spike protein [Levilactobacillus lindianensis]|uniref:Gp138 family membrane-puncturing spike protein n=1 Tax=Levilactobacillus lindianensis TaxID=2486018 RepID=UPI000F745EBB|nr:Gp138 family membrane-puncturing spike protein [Levilactobacillus lindianensis]